MESHRPSKRVANAVMAAAAEEEKEDRLSALPDDLLHAILRSVPLKHAVRTAALSRRWAPLWLDALASSPVLDLGDRAFARAQPPAQAAAAVRRCLRLHAERGAPLDAFRLAFRSPAGGFAPDVVAWVAAALARGAAEVALHLTPTRWRRAVDDRWAADDLDDGVDATAFLELPAALFEPTTSLTHLALVRCSLRAVPPSAPGLAGLRSLSLSHADVTDWHLRDILATLHSLEILTLRSCNLLSYVKVAGAKLRRLELVGCLAVREVWVGDAPALESFVFHGDISYFSSGDSVLAYFRSATPALRDSYLSHLCFGYAADGDDFYDLHCFAYYHLLNCVARSTTLTICSAGLQHIDAARAAARTMDETELRCQLHSLTDQQFDVITRASALTMDMPNLQELQLLMPSLGDDDVDRVAGFFELTKPPILDRLFIRVVHHRKFVKLATDSKRSRGSSSSTVPDDEDDAEIAASNSDLVLDHLKFIKVLNFRGTRSEVRLLRFLMDRAPALEHLVLVTVEEEQGTLRDDEQMKIIQRRLSAMRMSESAVARVTVCRPSEDGSRNPARTRFYHE
ncbi:hypothetical protein QOZ80_1BG0053400 [Eleusine coracana subsp. coracana]|nr:hypothetical protein QOZ80_1BG0053400 [Eleusine coracana subsp. coracana]